MRNMSKIIAVMTVVCLGAYGLHKWQAPKAPAPAGAAMLAPHLSAADIAPAASAAPDATAATDRTASVLVYPDPSAALALHLGYEVFTQQADGSMMALPLPPQAAWQTQLALPAAGHKRLALALSDPKCGFPVAVKLYRADRAEPAWQGELVAASAAKQVVELSTVSGADPLLVTLKMADGATNNWSCNVALHFDDAP